MKRYYRDLLIDLVVIIATAILAIFVFRDFHFAPNIFYVFIAGIFFTSAFTIAPAAIVLANLSQALPLHLVIVAGALGAMVGDYLLFVFIRDRFAKDLMQALKHAHVRVVLRSFHFGFMKWLSPLIGAAIIASPLPDEFGIMLMGVSKMKTRYFLLITFVMNMIGVLVVVGFSHLF